MIKPNSVWLSVNTEVKTYGNHNQALEISQNELSPTLSVTDGVPTSPEHQQGSSTGAVTLGWHSSR
jgi:hypothetical protein